MVLLPGCASAQAAALHGNLSALAFDYVVRQKLGGTDLRNHYVKQFAVLPPWAHTHDDLDFIVYCVLELTYMAHDLAPFARDLGYDGPPFIWDEEPRAHLRADLDAYYASLCGPSRRQLRYVLDPHDLTDRELEDILDDRDDPPDAPRTTTFPGDYLRALKEREIRERREYRTKKLVLEGWDRLGLAPRRADYHQRAVEGRADGASGDIVIETVAAYLTPTPQGPALGAPPPPARAFSWPEGIGRVDAPVIEMARPAVRKAGTAYRSSPTPARMVAECGATADGQENGQGAIRKTPLPGLPEPEQRPARISDEDRELRQRVLERCLETLAATGPLRARDLAQRLASLDRRIDRHLVDSVLYHHGRGGCVRTR
jgi:hypothetical protein